MSGSNEEMVTTYCRLTKRQLFAAMAMQGLLQKRNTGYWDHHSESLGQQPAEWIDESPQLAREALRVADALLAELEKSNGK